MHPYNDKKMNEYYDKVAKSGIIRLRCQQIHKSETQPNTFSVSKRYVKCNIKQIRTLKHNSNHIFYPQKILDLQRSYISQIYTETSYGNTML